MDTGQKNSGGKLHIIIAIVIGIEIIALLALFGFFVKNKSNSDTASISTEAVSEESNSESDITGEAEESTYVKEESQPSPTPAPTPEPVVYIQHTVDGITFEIPDKYKNSNGNFKSEYSQLYIISKKIQGFWALYMIASDSDIDGYADTYVNQYFSGAKREAAEDATVAGCKGRKYRYSATYNGEKCILVANVIVSPNKDGVIAVIFLTPEKNSELEDYNSIISTATK